LRGVIGQAAGDSGLFGYRRCFVSETRGSIMANQPFGPAASTAALEAGTALTPKFDAQGLITAVATDAKTGQLLMVAHMNAEALALTIETGEVHYWSRSRQALWHKGATSGHAQKLVELRIDCDQDCVWLKVEAHGPGQCHVGYAGCFYRVVGLGGPAADARLETVEVKSYDPEKVYGG
jgi:phosphoribosyl-AMP cyclohydrolase